MSEPSNGPKDRTIRTDQWQPPRGSRTLRADNDARHRPQAGEYGEGAAHETTGVGPRRAADSGVPGAQGQPQADDRLRELIRERLTEDPEIDAADVTIDVHAGNVTLTGSVSNERARDVVEQCVENCGARAVHNRLGVR